MKIIENEFIKRTIETDRDIMDVKGWKISKGTKLFVMKEGPRHPRDGYRLLVVRVDNGTDDLALMPETAIREEKNDR